MDIESIIETVTLEEINKTEETTKSFYEGEQADAIMIMIAFD